MSSPQDPSQDGGLTRAVLAVSDSPTYNFGGKAVNSTNEKTLTVTNSGDKEAIDVAMTGTAAPYSFKGEVFQEQGGTCTSTISNGNCTLVVEYSPTQLGASTDTLNITYNNGLNSGRTTSLDLSGTSVAPAAPSISDGETFDFTSKGYWDR